MTKVVRKPFLEGIEDGIHPKLSGRKLAQMQKVFFATAAHAPEGMDFSDFALQLTELMKDRSLFTAESDESGMCVFRINEPSELRRIHPHAILGLLHMHIKEHKDAKAAVFDDGTITTMITQAGDITQHPTPKAVKHHGHHVNGNGAGHILILDEEIQTA